MKLVSVGCAWGDIKIKISKTYDVLENTQRKNKHVNLDKELQMGAIR